MSENLVIRRAGSADVPSIIGLWREFMEFHSARNPRVRHATDAHEAFASFLQGKLRDAGAAVWVANLEQIQVGYCLAVLSEAPPVFLDRRHGEIVDVAVTARFRRRGIGEALVDVAMGWLQEQGVARVELRVLASNEVASAFWKKMGFTPYVETLSREL